MKMTRRQAHAVADTKLTVLVDSDPGAAAVARALPNAYQPSRIRVLNRCGSAAANAENLLVFSAASKLDQVAECVSVANKAHRLAALLVHNDVAADWLLYVFHHSGLRTLRNTIVHSDPELPTRILNAWAMGGERDFIADAAVIKNRLVVRSCAFEEYSLSFDAFPALQRIPDSARSSFVFEEEGLLLCWPDFQVHLDLEDIRFANNPKRQQAARTERLGDQRAIGAALRRLREEAGLKQSEITGMSERQVRRVESGDRLTVDALDAFAAAMHLDPDLLLERLSETLHRVTSTNAEPPGPSTLADPPRAVSEGAPEARVLAYPLSSAIIRRPLPAKAAEPLQLAAESSETTSPRRWKLTLGTKGAICGRLENDFRTDELLFVIDECDDSRFKSVLMSLVLQSSRLSEPLVSEPFTPKLGARISVARGRGLVPGDISSLDLRVVNES